MIDSKNVKVSQRNKLLGQGIQYYTNKVQKGAIVEGQHHRICAEMIINHLEQQGCEKQLLDDLQDFFIKNQLGQHQAKMGLDVSLYELISNNIGTSHESIVQTSLKRYVQKQVAPMGRESHYQRIAQRGQQIQQLNGGRRINPAKELPLKYTKKLKTCFGHALHPDNQDQEDPYIPVYNIIYDRTGQLLVTGDDMGLIKIWSASNGLLLQSLKGHTMAINSMDISHCNRYLASCSNDGLALVWEIQTCRPIAVLKESQDDPILVLLYFQDKDTNYLALASEKGFVYIYKLEDIKKCNGGMLGTQYNQKLRPSALTFTSKIIRLQIPIRTQYTKEKITKQGKNGIICMEFNKQGYLALGTEKGEVLVWDKPDDLIGNHIVKAEWHEHTAECHLVKWSKEGDWLLTASFDGSARLWRWKEGGIDQNINNKSEVIMKYNSKEAKRFGDISCQAISWSARSQLVLASFSRKVKKRGDEEKAKTQFQIFSIRDLKLVNIIDLEDFADIVGLDVKVILLEAHPKYEEIALSADENGIILLWNVISGFPIKIFHERGYHMKLPNLEVPLLDGCFSPNGLTFVVSSDFGSFSIYGYGIGETFNQTPTEQFYVSDSEHPIIDESHGFRVLALDSDMEFCFVDRGSICNFYRMPYQYNFFTNFKQQSSYLLGIEQQGKRSVSYQKPKQYQYILTAKGIQVDNLKNEEMFVGYFEEVAALEMKIQQEIRKLQSLKELEKAHQLDQDIDELFCVGGNQQQEEDDEGEEEEEQQISSSNHKILRKYENKQKQLINLHVQKNQNLFQNNGEEHVKGRKRRLIDSDDDEPEEQQQFVKQCNNFQQESSQSEEVITTRFRRRNQQQRLQNLNTHRQIHNRTELCVRCKDYIQNRITLCNRCYQKYHQECAEQRLYQIDSGQYYCIKCLKSYIKSTTITDCHRNTTLDPNIPQIGDIVIFFTLGYENYIANNLYQMDITKLSDTVFPGDDYPEQESANYLYCKVVGSSYIFPTNNYNLNKKYFKEIQKKYYLQQIFELEYKTIRFNVIYSSNFEQYLILEQVYEHCVHQVRPLLTQNVLLQTDQDKDEDLGFSYQFIEQDCPDKRLIRSDWHIIKCKRIMDKQNVFLNFWDIAAVQKNSKIIEIQGSSLQSALTELEMNQIIKDINSMLRRQVRIGYFFASDIDLKQYPEYSNYVPISSYIQLIQNKLESYFYRTRDEIMNDVQRIRSNAYLFNPPQSEVCLLSEKLYNLFYAIVIPQNGEQQQQQQQQKISYEIQTRKKKKPNHYNY